MTTLEQLNLSQPLTDVYTAMETDLMMAIARQLAAGGEINATSEWRLKKLAEAGALSKETVQIIASYTGIQSDLISETIESAAMSIVDRLEPALQACAKDGYITVVSGTPISASVGNVVTNFRKQAKTDLNLVNTVMQYKANSAYKNLVNQIYDDTKRQELLGVLGKHTLEVASGGTSRQEAVRNCIKEFSQKGIPAFVDKRGREWSPEAYINMDIRTTVHNTAHAAQDACCEKYGIDLIQISSHMGARPKCALDQGKLFSTSNRSGVAHDGDGNPITFYPWSSSSYGEPDGILGINCHHHKYPFVDGVNFQRYFPYDQEENAERYKEFQKQRAMERRVRETSRQADMLEAAGDTEGAKEARRKLREQRKAYREYSNEHGLSVHNDRLTVVKVRNGDISYKNIYSSGIDKSETMNLVTPNKIRSTINSATMTSQTMPTVNLPIDNSGESGIIKEKMPAPVLSLDNLSEFENWQNEYYEANKNASFSISDNPNINKYSGGAYELVNGVLRGGKQLERLERCNAFDKLGREEYEKMAENISAELSKFKLNTPLNLKRSVSNVDFITGATSSIEDMKRAIGLTYTEKGFTSTTVCSDAMLPFGGLNNATRTTLEIYAPQNTRGAYIYKMSDHPAEFEFLIDKNTSFKIIDAGEREIEVKNYKGEIRIEIERYIKLEVIPK